MLLLSVWRKWTSKREKKGGWGGFWLSFIWGQRFPIDVLYLAHQTECQALKLRRESEWMKEKDRIRSSWGITGRKRFWKYINWCHKVKSAGLNLWLVYTLLEPPLSPSGLSDGHLIRGMLTLMHPRPAGHHRAAILSILSFPKWHFSSRGGNLSGEKRRTMPALWGWAKNVLQYTQWQQACLMA